MYLHKAKAALSCASLSESDSASDADIEVITGPQSDPYLSPLKQSGARSVESMIDDDILAAAFVAQIAKRAAEIEACKIVEAALDKLTSKQKIAMPSADLERVGKMPVETPSQITAWRDAFLKLIEDAKTH